MLTYTSKEGLAKGPGEKRFPPVSALPPLEPGKDFDSAMVGSFMEALGVSSACELVNPSISESPMPLDLGHDIPLLAMDFPAETFEGPAFDLVVSRSLCRPLEGRGFPSQLVAMEELRRLTCLARRYVIVQFPPKAPFSLSSLALQLDTGFSLEGFVPLPESGPESDPGGSPQGLPGDYYILANSQAGAPLPAPFGISGGPSVLSPIRIQGGAPGELSDALSRLRRLEDQGRLPEAIPFAFKLAALRPWDAKIRVTLAMNLAIMGKVVEGERILRGVLAENPNDRMARMALLKIFQKSPEETKDDIWDIRPEPRFHSDMPPKPPVTSPDLRDAWDEGGLG